MAINPQEFDYKESRWQDIYTCLKNAGFDVYAPQIKDGECTAPYVVVANGVTTQYHNFSSEEQFYSVMCYVPKKQYSKLEPYYLSVKEAMKELEPMLRFEKSITGSYYDDALKAHMVSLDYINVRKS